jgi:hypothetical protein
MAYFAWCNRSRMRKGPIGFAYTILDACPLGNEFVIANCDDGTPRKRVADDDIRPKTRSSIDH